MSYTRHLENRISLILSRTKTPIPRLTLPLIYYWLSRIQAFSNNFWFPMNDEIELLYVLYVVLLYLRLVTNFGINIFKKWF